MKQLHPAERWLNWPARHPFAAIGVALLLAVGAMVATLRLRADTSLQRLFPKNDQSAAALVHVLTDFPTAEEFLILVTTPGESPHPADLLDYAENLQRAIADDPGAKSLVSSYSYRVDAQTKQFVTNVLAPSGLFYLNDKEFTEAKERLTLPRMKQQLQQDEAMLATPGPAASALAKVLMQDPLRLYEFIENKLSAARPMQTYQGTDAFISSDGRSLLIRIAGVRPPSDLAFCGKMTDTLSALANRTNSHGLKLEFSGAYAIAAQSQRSIEADAKEGMMGSIVCLALLFLLMFRRSLPLFFMTFAPVALGTLYGLGVYALVNRNVSPLTAVIGSMLAGIGLDYSIFYLVYFQRRIAAGDSSEQAAGTTIRTIVTAMVAAWATSIVGFIAVGFVSIPALRDFAVLGSLGLTVALAGGILILPACLMLLDRWTKKPARARFSIAPLVNWIDRHQRVCLGISIAIIVIAVGYLAVVGPVLEMESDATVLHPRPNPPLDAEAHIQKVMGIGADSLIVYLKTNNPDQLLRLAHRVEDELASESAKRAGVVGTFGLANLLPDPNLAAARENQIGPALAERVQADFDAAVAQSSFRPQAFEKYRTFLRYILSEKKPPGVADLLPYPQLAKLLLPRQAFEGSPPTEAIMLVTISQPLETREAREVTVSALRDILKDVPGATLTGMAVLSVDTEKTIRHDLPRFVLAAVGITIVYLLLHFRSLTMAALSVLPTVCSLIILLAIARACGARLNMANIVAIPLLIGIDVDYGIFLVSIARGRALRDELLAQAPAGGQAVLICAAATLLGFGSLAWTSVPAVRSLGWAVAIGVASCAAATLFLLLPILLWRLRSNGRAHRNIESIAIAEER